MSGGGDEDFLLEYIRHHTAFLFHLTHVENLAGIAAMGGLLSKARLEARGAWPCPVPGGDAGSHAADRARGTWDLVSLAVTPQHPMLSRRRLEWGQNNVCLLRIDAAITAGPGVLFARSNAIRADVLPGEGIRGVGEIDFDAVVRGWAGGASSAARQAEVLVPSTVPGSVIREAVFGSMEAATGMLDHVRSIEPSIRIKWDAAAFFDIPVPWRPPTAEPTARPDRTRAAAHTAPASPLLPVAVGVPRRAKSRYICEYCGRPFVRGSQMVMARFRGEGEPMFEAYVHVDCVAP